MFSKTSLVTGLLAITLGLGACDSKVGEAPPPPTNQEFGGAQCLSAVKPVVTSFIKGEATTRDIEASWDCAGSVVEKFKRYVRGRASDRYTAQELATFLEKNFLSGETITPQLQTEFMKLKQLFVGGSGEYLTREEIDKLLVLFDNFSDISVRINPYMKVFVFNWSASDPAKMQDNIKYFEQANIEIQNAARSLADLIEKNSQSYLLSDFVVLTNELSAFFGESWEFPEQISLYMPIIQKVKKALAGGAENSIVPSEWARFLLLGSRGYVQYLRYYYFLQSVPETGMAYRLSYIASSADDLLSIFQDFVSEKPEGKVTREELGEFLKTLGDVWPSFKISDKLLLESMRIKQLLFGGNLTDFTTQDFEKARSKVVRVKSVTERFLPYYNVYSGDWDPSLYSDEEAQEFFAEAKAALHSASKDAALLFETSYDLKDLISLLEEVERLYPPAKGEEGFATAIKKYVPLILDTKNMIFGTNDTILHKDHWPAIANLASRVYSEYLYYGYFIKDKPTERLGTLLALSNVSNQTLNLVKELIEQKKQGYFSKTELNKLAIHLVKLDILPSSFSSDSIDRILDVVLNRVLVTPERRLQGAKPNVLNASAVEVARQELQIWLDTQAWIAKQTENLKSSEGFRSSRMVQLLQNAKGSSSSSKALKIGTGELLLAVSSPVPMTVDSEGRLNISNREVHYYTAKSLTRLNMNRTVTRIAIRAFITSTQRLSAYSGVTLDEAQNAFKSLRSVLVQMGVIDQKNTTFAASRFREANIFVPHSDGNTLLSFAEGVDLVGMIWSGLAINTKMKNYLFQDCFNGRSHVRNSEKVSVKCAAASYRRHLSKAASSMPEHTKFYTTLPEGMWPQYIENVFKSAGYVPDGKGVASLNDIMLAPHVIQYIEMLYARFDTSKDNYISTEEAINAFPAFKGVMLELAADQIKNGTIKESDLIDVFGFILRYGHPPTTLGEKMKFLFSWKGKPEKWDIWAGRSQLSEILGYIADEVNKAAKNNKPVKMDFNLKTSER